MREYFVYFPFFILHDWGKRSAEERSSHLSGVALFLPVSSVEQRKAPRRRRERPACRSEAPLTNVPIIRTGFVIAPSERHIGRSGVDPHAAIQAAVGQLGLARLCYLSLSSFPGMSSPSRLEAASRAWAA